MVSSTICSIMWHDSVWFCYLYLSPAHWTVQLPQVLPYSFWLTSTAPHSPLLFCCSPLSFLLPPPPASLILFSFSPFLPCARGLKPSLYDHCSTLSIRSMTKSMKQEMDHVSFLLRTLYGHKLNWISKSSKHTVYAHALSHMIHTSGKSPNPIWLNPGNLI